MDPVTTSIMANPAMQDDYDGCVILYKNFIKQTMTTEIRTYGKSEPMVEEAVVPTWT